MGDVIGFEYRKARKTHRCLLCTDLIEPGTRYARWLWLDCHDVGVVKVHTGCEDCWDLAADEVTGEADDLGLMEALRHCAAQDLENRVKDPAELSRLMLLWQKSQDH